MTLSWNDPYEERTRTPATKPRCALITLEGGPAAGIYPVKRAPLLLRAVVNRNNGEKDVLDQLTDRPGASDKVYVYKREGPAGSIRMNLGRKGCPCYALARYSYLGDDPNGELLDTAAWREWCKREVVKA